MAIKFFNVYSVTRHYGGPEEGGWWYNWHALLETLPFEEDAKSQEMLRDHLKKKYANEEYGDISSVLGGQEIDILVEDRPGQSASTEVPHYE